MRSAHRLALSAGIVALAASLGGGAVVASRTAATRSAPATAAERLATSANRASAAALRAATEFEAARLRSDGVPNDATAERAERRSGESDAVAVSLDEPQVALGTALAVAGRDLGAPRPLELWRLGAARSARVAEGHSDAEGSLVFPALVLPAGEVTLVAAPRGSGPHGPGASSPTTLRRDPSAPRVERVEQSAPDGASLALRVTPAEPAGAIVVIAANAAGAIELARAPVAESPESSAVALEISLPPLPAGRSLEVMQELPDGRRSAPYSVVLATPTAVENPDADPIAVVSP